MFTWICPKCGREVPPSYSDCPNCAANEKPAAAATPAPPEVTTAPPAPVAVPPPPSPVYAAPQAPPAAVMAPQPPAFAPLHPRPVVAQAPPSPPPPVSVAPPPPPPPAPAAPANIPFGKYSDPTPQVAVKKGLNPIVATLLAALCLVAVLYGVYSLLGNKKSSEAATSAAPTAGQAPEAAAPVTSTNSTHPLAKHFELAGLRINESGKGGMTLQFLVINHSAADLPELKMMIHVKTTEGKPLYDFPVNIPSIGPFESKDLSVPMKTKLRGYELPDWQFLRGSFEITSQP